MLILQIVGIGLIATILIVVIREHQPEMALQLTILVGVLFLLLMMDKIISVVTVLNKMAQEANISLMYLTIIFKIIGIAYIAEFGAQICKDAGANVVASKIEFAAKILIMILAFPIMHAIMDSVLTLLSQ